MSPYPVLPQSRNVWHWHRPPLTNRSTHLNPRIPSFYRQGLDAIPKDIFFRTQATIPFLRSKIVYKIQKRIIDQLEFKDFKLPKYHHGIVASYAGENDTVFEHTDPQWYPPYETLHCNLMLQKSLQGGNPIINKKNIIPWHQVYYVMVYS